MLRVQLGYCQETARHGAQTCSFWASCSYAAVAHVPNHGPLAGGSASGAGVGGTTVVPAKMGLPPGEAVLRWAR